MSETRLPVDHQVRREVVEPAGSFIVQAPAGSGKTELLTQRFLRLLAGVDQPQKVLAITFTRKATREMLDRVLERLRDADAGRIPEEAHQHVAHGFALAALKRDREEGWNLLDNPGLLQIHTIDGLCARLAGRGGDQRLSLAGLSVAEYPGPAYREAARRTLDDASRSTGGHPVREALEGLLLRERGDANRLLDLLAEELPRRDQWLSDMAGAPDQADLLAERQRLEIANLESALGRDRLEEAGDLLSLLPPSEKTAATESLAEAWAGAQSGDPADRAWGYWRVVNRLSTTQSAPYKPRSLGSQVAADTPDRDGVIESLGAIVETWHASRDALDAFKRFHAYPPLDREPGDRDLLDQLAVLLTHACAQLDVVFAETGVCDFQHVARLALQSLGDEETPGEALLIEDGRLEHVLIDEFQDTSILQYRLVERLVAGWTPGDGRTLFLVGDPMQSIYRFRKAEVGLFQEVSSTERLGDVALAHRRLQVNFRSRASVIDEVNGVCGALFRPPSPGATSHVDYTPVDPYFGAGGEIVYRGFRKDHDDAVEREARWIAARVAQLLAGGEVETVGVLARARAHLEPVARALAEGSVDFEAVDVQSLDQRPVVLDLLTLTRALLHPGDRVAWLGLLLGPWCALQPEALLQVAGDRNSADLVDRCLDPGVIDGLGREDRERVVRVGEVLRSARDAAGRAGLARRVESAWVRLGAPRVARSVQDLEDAEVFLALLARLEREQPEDFLGELEERLDKLYAGSREAGVKLMTIHKAKGLEFDAVFLPALERGTGNDRRALFRQHDVGRTLETRGTLMAPLKPAGSSTPGLFDYLGMLEREAQASEAQRLLYVAMTRARRFLHLSAVCGIRSDGGIRRQSGSFLAMLEERFETVLEDPVEGSPGEAVMIESPSPAHHLRLGSEAPVAVPVPVHELVTLGEAPPDRERLALGEALHRWLELIHDHWDEHWTGDWYLSHQQALRSSLALAGASSSEVPRLAGELVDLLRELLTNPDVCRLLDPAGKTQSLAEAEYLRPRGSRLERFIVDRLYQDAKGRWHVIDYKTGADGDDTQGKWRRQLDDYAEIVAAAEQGPVTETRVLQAGTGRFIDPEG